MRATLTLSVLVLLAGLASAQQELPETLSSYQPVLEQALPAALPSYLPAGTAYDDGVPEPADVFGWEPGAWHVRPDLLVAYFRALAEASPRVSLVEYGRTHEQRPLLLAAITSEANQARLEDLRRAHVEALARGEAAPEGTPAIVWMGYSVHGNEPSGANASPVVAYHLAAGQGRTLEQVLERTIVLIDPCINPDGLARFAHWANMHKGVQLVADGQHREHREPWPSGRTNHYWFDLNRDWLLLTHPESRGRLEQFHRWRPQVLTDHHEMGTGSTFFFQPGVPSRQNPRTPARNLDLTRAIAGFHAQALDAIGSQYYSEESFDDFYYGKGSTYPDVWGSIGILFEQASSRGHLQENSLGPVSFPFTIRNQVTTSLSTLAAVAELGAELQAYQAETIRSAREEAAGDPLAGWVFGDPADPARGALLVDLLRRHRITVQALDGEGLTVDGTAFPAGASWYVPHDQDAYRLVRSCFETRTEFLDDTFYDVSTWTLPLAFDLPHAGVARADLDGTALGPALDATPTVRGWSDAPDHADAAAWLLEWPTFGAPAALAELLGEGVLCRVATRPFTAVTGDGPRAFAEGTVVIPRGHQAWDPSLLAGRLAALARQHGVTLRSVTSGLTPEGVDLGSPTVSTIEPPRPLIVVGPGVSSYEAGEMWHQLDLRWGLTVGLLEGDRLRLTTLADYTHVVLVGGASAQLDDRASEALADWVRAGGVVIATRGGATWAGRELLGLSHEDRDEDEEAPPPAEALTYGDYEEARARSVVGGAIFEATIDRSHPLGFGFDDDRLALFRRGTTTLADGGNPFEDALVYTDEPLLSGYCSARNADRIAGTAAASARRMGGGTVIRLADDPCFRGYWRGAERLLANALFFGTAIKSTRALSDDAALDEH